MSPASRSLVIRHEFPFVRKFKGSKTDSRTNCSPDPTLISPPLLPDHSIIHFRGQNTAHSYIAPASLHLGCAERDRHTYLVSVAAVSSPATQLDNDDDDARAKSARKIGQKHHSQTFAAKSTSWQKKPVGKRKERTRTWNRIAPHHVIHLFG